MIAGLGKGGWAIFWPGDRMVVRVRFADADDGRLEACELHVDSGGGDEPLTKAALRMPLAQMEAWANGHARDELLAAIETESRKVQQASARWRSAVGEGGSVTISDDLARQIRRTALRLKVPSDRMGHPAEFYERVAVLYMELTKSGSRKPAQEIADSNDVEVTTVHRWIREARRRELLGKGRRGKAG